MKPAAFDRYLGFIEARYRPPWSVYDAVEEAVRRNDCDAVFDFGAGTGRLAKTLEASDAQVTRYIGLERDVGRMTFARRTCRGRLETTFTDSSEEFAAMLASSARPAFVAAFCLHDQSSLEVVLAAIDDSPANTFVVAWDLTPADLPRLSRIFRNAAVGAASTEVRGRIGQFSTALGDRGWVVRNGRQHHSIRFPTANSVLDYIDAFNLADGDDLGIRASRDLRAELQSAARGLCFPFDDEREFASLEARRPIP